MDFTVDFAQLIGAARAAARGLRLLAITAKDPVTREDYRGRAMRRDAYADRLAMMQRRRSAKQKAAVKKLECGHPHNP